MNQQLSFTLRKLRITRLTSNADSCDSKIIDSPSLGPKEDPEPRLIAARFTA
jgi:hypothetical protein